MKCPKCFGQGSTYAPCYGKEFDPGKLPPLHQIYLALVEEVIAVEHPELKGFRLIMEVGCDRCGGSGIGFHVYMGVEVKPRLTLEDPVAIQGCGVTVETPALV